MALLMTSLFAILSGCDCNEPENALPGEVLLEFSTSWNQEPFALGDVVTDHLNHPLRIDNLQMYIAPIEMRDDQGDWVEIKDVSLLDFDLLNQRIKTSLAAGTYDALRFGMGLPPAINTDIDPASYANSHPLSVPGSAGMFWTWSSGYVFVKYEGKFATESGAIVSVRNIAGENIAIKARKLNFLCTFFQVKRTSQSVCDDGNL